MLWEQKYLADQKPDLQEINAFIDNPLWLDLANFLAENYSVEPQIEYSRCASIKGWNIKYKKSSKSICIIYPKNGYFLCMVTIGAKQAMDTELLLPDLDPYLQELYAKTVACNNSKWLVIEMKNQAILEDTKKLIQLKTK